MFVAGIISESGSIWKHNRTFAVIKLRGFGYGKRSFEVLWEKLMNF